MIKEGQNQRFALAGITAPFFSLSIPSKVIETLSKAFFRTLPVFLHLAGADRTSAVHTSVCCFPTTGVVYSPSFSALPALRRQAGDPSLHCLPGPGAAQRHHGHAGGLLPAERAADCSPLRHPGTALLRCGGSLACVEAQHDCQYSGRHRLLYAAGAACFLNKKPGRPKGRPGQLVKEPAKASPV